jgi:hypothetical protein
VPLDARQELGAHSSSSARLKEVAVQWPDLAVARMRVRKWRPLRALGATQHFAARTTGAAAVRLAQSASPRMCCQRTMVRHLRSVSSLPLIMVCRR